MIATVFASALLWRAADNHDVDAIMAKVHAARVSYNRCIFQHAKDMYHGSDSPSLEKAILDSCSSQLDDYVNANTDPGAVGRAGRAAFRASMEANMPSVVHMAIQALSMCAEDDPHRAEGGHTAVVCEIPSEP